MAPPQLTYGKPIDLHADVPVLPPFAMATTVLLGLASWLLTGVRLSFVPSVMSWPLRGAGFAFMLAGGWMMLGQAGKELEKSGSGTAFTPVSGLATGGAYRYTRNPMYSFLVFGAVPGMSVTFDCAWPLVLVPVLWLYLHNVVIAVEEKLLSQTLGPAYEVYCENTPRWILCF